MVQAKNESFCELIGSGVYIVQSTMVVRRGPGVVANGGTKSKGWTEKGENCITR